MAIKGEVYRMTIASEEILGTLEALSYLELSQLPSGARELLKKFQVQATKIKIGAATPAYMNTGRTQVAARVTLESLGGDEDAQNHTIRNLSTASVIVPSIPSASPKASADLNESEEQELARLEAAMLAELSAQGNENVVLEDRRKVPREDSDDSALFSSLY